VVGVGAFFQHCVGILFYAGRANELAGH